MNLTQLQEVELTGMGAVVVLSRTGGGRSQEMPGHTEQLWDCSKPPSKAAAAGTTVELPLARH